MPASHWPTSRVRPLSLTLITTTTAISASQISLFVCLRRFTGRGTKETPLIQFLQLPRHFLPSHRHVAPRVGVLAFVLSATFDAISSFF
jgi:hypothetical protein